MYRAQSLLFRPVWKIKSLGCKYVNGLPCSAGLRDPNFTGVAPPPRRARLSRAISWRQATAAWPLGQMASAPGRRPVCRETALLTCHMHALQFPHGSCYLSIHSDAPAPTKGAPRLHQICTDLPFSFDAGTLRLEVWGPPYTSVPFPYSG